MRDPLQTPRLRHFALLCVLLLAFSGLVQAMHVHPQDTPRGDADKARCSLCLAGHAPQQAVAKVDVVPPQPIDTVPASTSKGILHEVAGHAARIRPPPAA